MGISLRKRLRRTSASSSFMLLTKYSSTLWLNSATSVSYTHLVSPVYSMIPPPSRIVPLCGSVQGSGDWLQQTATLPSAD